MIIDEKGDVAAIAGERVRHQMCRSYISDLRDYAITHHASAQAAPYRSISTGVEESCVEGSKGDFGENGEPFVADPSMDAKMLSSPSSEENESIEKSVMRYCGGGDYDCGANKIGRGMRWHFAQSPWVWLLSLAVPLY
jgi:hypothetical protein